MNGPIPSFTGGASNSGPVTSGTDVRFAPVSVGGLFGSASNASNNDFLMPALIVGGAILAYTLLRKK